MGIAKARINNSLTGWHVVALNDEANPIIARLYGHDSYEEHMQDRPSDRAYMKGEPVETFTAHVIRIAGGMGIRCSKCGSKANPTLQLWMDNPTPPRQVKISVDLKWSCWAAYETHWLDRVEQEDIDKMRVAFEGTGPVCEVQTSAAKEGTFGNVVISKGRASGWFAQEWDEPHEIAETLGQYDEHGNWDTGDWEPPAGMSQQKINDDCLAALIESLPGSMYAGAVGIDWDFDLRARKFANMLRRVDAEEDNFLAASKREWLALKQIYASDIPFFWRWSDGG